MIQKSRTLSLSAILLLMGTFSVHAMEPEKKQSRTRQQLTERPEKYRNKVYKPALKKPIELNQFGVTPFEYEGVILSCSSIRNRNNFEELFALFAKIPVEQRSEALEDLESKIISRGFRPMFSSYNCTKNGAVTNTPTKIKDAISLKDWILQLPYEPI